MCTQKHAASALAWIIVHLYLYPLFGFPVQQVFTLLEPYMVTLLVPIPLSWKHEGNSSEWHGWTINDLIPILIFGHTGLFRPNTVFSSRCCAGLWLAGTTVLWLASIHCPTEFSLCNFLIFFLRLSPFDPMRRQVWKPLHTTLHRTADQQIYQPKNDSRTDLKEILALARKKY